MWVSLIIHNGVTGPQSYLLQLYYIAIHAATSYITYTNPHTEATLQPFSLHMPVHVLTYTLIYLPWSAFT